jgi:hypothetical protein
MIGQRIGDYEILSALKSGGMGDVLLARRHGPAGFEQLCAVKTVRAELAATPVARAMFLDEARLLARLSHPGIAQIIDFGEASGVAFMVMEYVPGMSFRGLSDKAAPPAVVCQAVAQACRGLHAAHELRDLIDGHLLGVVHRDISPDNLMLGYDARVKVLDFGIALVRGRQAPVTELGTLKGKPPYMSPEQLKNHALDRRSDVFSIAVVLWELLAREPLFRGDSIYAVARAVEEQVIAPPSSRTAGLPADLDDVVLAGLAREPSQRLASAAAMAEVLERIAARAGGSSLEAWTERALAEEREHHRRWLAQVIAGGRAAGGPGRPSGVATAIDATGVREATRVTVVDVAEPTIEDVVAPTHEVAERREASAAEAGPTLVEAASADGGARPPRRRWPLALGGLGGVGAIAAVVWSLGRGGGAATVAMPDAGAIDALPVDAAEVVAGDAAAVDATAIEDAGPPDAPEPRRPDGRPPRSPVDAAVAVARPIDAGPAAAPPIDAAVATGRLAVRAWSPAALVTVDGRDWGETPILPRKLPVGTRRGSRRPRRRRRRAVDRSARRGWPSARAGRR